MLMNSVACWPDVKYTQSLLHMCLCKPTMKGTRSWLGSASQQSISEVTRISKSAVNMSSYSNAAPVLAGKTTHDEPFSMVTQHKYQLDTVNINAASLNMDTNILLTLSPISRYEHQVTVSCSLQRQSLTQHSVISLHNQHTTEPLQCSTIILETKRSLKMEQHVLARRDKRIFHRYRRTKLVDVKDANKQLCKASVGFTFAATWLP